MQGDKSHRILGAGKGPTEEREEMTLAWKPGRPGRDLWARKATLSSAFDSPQASCPPHAGTPRAAPSRGPEWGAGLRQEQGQLIHCRLECGAGPAPQEGAERVISGISISPKGKDQVMASGAPREGPDPCPATGQRTGPVNTPAQLVRDYP